MNYLQLVILVALTVLHPVVNATPFGAPADACVSMTPQHGFEPQTSPAPYGVYPRRVGQLFEVFIHDDSLVTPFKGFLIQARKGSDIVGKFVAIPRDAKYVTCKYDQSSVTHVDPTGKSELMFTWDPRGADLAGITFVASFVQQFDTFWTFVSSEDISTLQ